MSATCWIIVLTMPSGNKYAFSGHEGSLALVPIDAEHGTVRGAHAWNSRKEAEEALQAQLELAPKFAEHPERFSVQEMALPQ